MNMNQEEMPQDEMSQDEMPQDEMPQDEMSQDEMPQDEMPQDKMPQDEMSNKADTVETAPSQQPPPLQISFEEALQRLEQIVGSLNNGRAPLAEALSLFEEGAKLLQYCTTALEEAELKVNLLTDTGEQGTPALSPMPPQNQEVCSNSKNR